MSKRRWQPSTPWDSQPITNDVGARQPEHTFAHPVPIVARIVWETDGDELVQTTVLGWSGKLVYVRLADSRCRTNAIWLDAADVRRH